MEGMPFSVRRFSSGFLLLMAVLLACGAAAAGEEEHAAQWNGESGRPALAEEQPQAADGTGETEGGDTAGRSVVARLFDPVSSGVIVAVSWGVLAVLLVMRRRVAKTS